MQRNKVRKVLPVAGCLHSIDSLSLAARIDGLSAELGLRPRLLLEVNVSGEGPKDGFSLDQVRTDWKSLCADRRRARRPDDDGPACGRRRACPDHLSPTANAPR